MSKPLRKLLSGIIACAALSLAYADLSQKDYNYKYEVSSGTDAADNTAVNKCLRKWTTHPFGNTPQYRRMESGVRVFGLGSPTIEDEEKTSWPQLILVAPGVNIMGKMNYKLMNPNGWYCLKGNVTVLSKSEIKIGCNTHITTSGKGADVLGSNSDSSTKGAAVIMGKVQVDQPNCTK